MTESFNELEEKKTGSFALVVGITLATIILGIFSFIVILASSEKIENFWDTGKKPKTKTEVHSTKLAINDMPAGKTYNLGLFNDYMPKMQQQIKSNWEPVKREVSSTVVVKYEIMKDGKLGDYEIISSSADKQVEKAAIKALKKSSPFEPLPEGFTGDKVDVQFTFDYKVHKK